MKTAHFKEIDWKHWLLLSGVLLVAFYLRFKGLTTQSFWVDELHTMKHIKPGMSIKDFYYSIITVKHPPLHAFLLRIWVRIFEYNDFWARTLSALIGVGGIGAAYFLGRCMIDKKLGLILAWVSTLNFFHLYYSQENRSYGLVFLITCLSYGLFIKLIKNPSVKGILLLGLTNALLLYTHYFAVFILFAQGITIGFLFIRKELSISDSLRIGLAYLTTLLLFAPWINTWVTISTSWNHLDRFLYLGGQDLINTFSAYFAEDSLHISIVVLCMFIPVVLISQQKHRWKDPLMGNPKQLIMMVIFVWIFIGYGCPYIMSLPPFHQKIYHTAIWFDRYTMICIPAILLLVSIGIYMIRADSFKWVMISLYSVSAIIAFTVTYGFYQRTYKAQWRHTAEYICEQNQSKHPIYGNMAYLHNYYFDQLDCGMRVEELKELDPLKEDTVWAFTADAHLRSSFKKARLQEYSVIEGKSFYRCSAWLLTNTKPDSEKNKRRDFLP